MAGEERHTHHHPPPPSGRCRGNLQQWLKGTVKRNFHLPALKISLCLQNIKIYNSQYRHGDILKGTVMQEFPSTVYILLITLIIVKTKQLAETFSPP